MRRNRVHGIALFGAIVALVLIPAQTLAASATGINVTVPSGKLSVTGVVKRAGGAPVVGGYVQLVDVATDGIVASSPTDTDGTYRMWDAPSGNYRIVVDPHLGSPTSMPGYYRATAANHFAQTAAAATHLHYTGTLLHASMTLPKGHSISGRIRTRVGGHPLKGVLVKADPAAGGSADYSIPAVLTDAQGNYTVPGLTNGAFTIFASRDYGSTLNVIGGCYKNAPPHNYAPNCTTGTDITVHSANVANKNLDLPSGHRISGTVRDINGHGLCADVGAEMKSPSFLVLQATGCGSFTIVAAPSGDYELDFSPAGASHFVHGEYANNPRHWTESGQPLLVHVGSSDVNVGIVKPSLGHTISGKVEMSNGSPIAGAFVTVAVNGSSDADTTTRADGSWSIRGVGSGAHTVEASLGESGKNVQSGYFRQGASGNFTRNKNLATVLSANVNHSGIVLKLPKGFSISGTITDSAHHGLNVSVSVYGAGGGSGAGTNAQGRYTVIGLSPGDYQLGIYPIDPPTRRHRSGYYDTNATGQFTRNYANATTIHVGP